MKLKYFPHVFFITFLNMALSTSSFTQICFSPATRFPIDSIAWAMVSADFNGDGINDIAAGNRFTKNVSILIGTGNGSFSSANHFPVSGFPKSIISVDFNGDGKMDLATANPDSNNVSVLLGNGLGGFSAATNFKVGNKPGAIIAADFNGDGIIDLATSNYWADSVSVLFGNGLGGFLTGADFAVQHGPQSLISADFNHDGKTDIATANQDSSSISILLNNGLGGFATAMNLIAGGHPEDIIAADFNGDSIIDIASSIITDSNLSYVAIFTGNGLGGFSNPVNFAVDLGSLSLLAADFNNDGIIDIATSNWHASTISVILGNGFGSFSAETSYITGVRPLKIITADFNRDGEMDLATSSQLVSNVSVHLNCTLKAGFSGTPDTVCSGQTVYFVDKSINTPNAWYWTFSGGTPYFSNSPTPAIIYDSIGTFNVKLVVTNATGTDSTIQNSYITVNLCLDDAPLHYNYPNSLEIFPNPTSGRFILEFEGSTHFINAEVKIYNAFGAQVFNEVITNSKNEINLKNVPNGIYLLQLNTAESLFERKIVVYK
ncbi:MAG: Alkaline phosphatase [Bacteroidota bacterium]|nr:Alkaline phosphatase [Bacteroidota bacterium]